MGVMRLWRNLTTPSFGLIRQVFLDLWSLENPDFGRFLIISAML
jgi:hypothetical protein